MVLFLDHIVARCWLICRCPSCWAFAWFAEKHHISNASGSFSIFFDFVFPFRSSEIFVFLLWLVDVM
jgi:hypothetical protein